jgi:hypothetical protein
LRLRASWRDFENLASSEICRIKVASRVKSKASWNQTCGKRWIDCAIRSDLCDSSGGRGEEIAFAIEGEPISIVKIGVRIRHKSAFHPGWCEFVDGVTVQPAIIQISGRCMGRVVRRRREQRKR